MSVNLPLDSMTVAEKLDAMEAIWASLRESAVPINSPEWHRDVLEERKRRLESGEATVSDWATVQKRLQELGQ